MIKLITRPQLLIQADGSDGDPDPGRSWTRSGGPEETLGHCQQTGLSTLSHGMFDMHSRFPFPDGSPMGLGFSFRVNLVSIYINIFCHSA